MSSDHVELRAGAYADSVRLLQVSRDVQLVEGVATAQVAMATPLNVEVLAGMGFAVPVDATANDLVVAVRLDQAHQLPAALAAVDQALRPEATTGPPAAEARPRTTSSALRGADGARLVLVSVPGASATVEAMDALEAGCDVMVFSDNVPVEEERALKRFAAQRDLLVMGPDCGTAVVGGVGLGFANVVTPGPVGVVAASGTGCQQLLCLLDHAGLGVTHALGVGGRDLSAEVGGLATRTALARLDADPTVELIVLVSKPPAGKVAAGIEEYAAGLRTPVELALLGPGRPDLTAVAERVLARSGYAVPDWPATRPGPLREREAARPGGRLRGLFVGGTLCEEARTIVADALGPERFELADFGADELTRGRAHPMIDPSLRLQHLERAAADERTSVLLLDVVLGHAAEPDPAARLAPAIAAAAPPVVLSLVGTAADPQDRAQQERALSEAGAEVHLSNARATRRALQLLKADR